MTRAESSTNGLAYEVEKAVEKKTEVNKDLTGALWHKQGTSKTGAPYNFYSGYLTINGQRFEITMNTVQSDNEKAPSFRLNLGKAIVEKKDSEDKEFVEA